MAPIASTYGFFIKFNRLNGQNRPMMRAISFIVQCKKYLSESLSFKAKTPIHVSQKPILLTTQPIVRATRDT
jgi:hypothetical protein